MPQTIKFIGALRHISGKKQLTLNCPQGTTIAEVVAALTTQFPAFKSIFSDQELNDAKSNSLILVNGKEISILEGYQTKVGADDEVVFVPVVHGG
ncbi:MAG: MoaD/ThiS family protein [Candidatus Bathyarchaeota archaeon]|nr:MoaD/ThiS family protein [Candidatus Bathyarchaeota archaeon]